MLIKELLQLNEASTPMRAWNGRLEKIDKLMAWMYDKGILNATERRRKDTVFNQYYRYYNDGDMPAALKTRGFSKYSNEKQVQVALEKYLEEFVKSMLTKYLPKVDREEFRLDTTIDALGTVIGIAERNDIESLLSYWIKTVKIADDSALKPMLTALDEKFQTLKKETEAVAPKMNLLMSYRREKMIEDKTWTPAMEKSWKSLVADLGSVTGFLKDLQQGFKDLKKQKLG